VKTQRGIGSLIRLTVALLMAFVVAAGPALANCDHGSHALLTTQGSALSADDHCPICDRAMPDVIVPPVADAPVRLERVLLHAEGLAVRFAEGVDPRHSGRGPPRMS
jgi:hypothetical protein